MRAPRAAKPSWWIMFFATASTGFIASIWPRELISYKGFVEGWEGKLCISIGVERCDEEQPQILK